MTAHGWLLGTGASAVLHGAFWLLAPTPEPPMVAPPTVFLIEIPVDAEPPPPPPPAEPEAPTPKAAPEPIARAPRSTAAPTLPDAARAGRTLVAEPAATPSPEIADFTLVQGTGDSFAGGTTTARGTSDRAVRGAVNDGSPRASASAPAPAAAPVVPAVDLSKPASAAGGDWSCSSLFPSDPDAPDRAAVTLVVDVDASGRASTIQVTADPGHGFGEAARRCARGQSFTPAKGPDGAAVAGKTRPFVVRFSR